MLPDGVGKISIIPNTLSPSHLNSLIKCETFFKLITEDSGWSNSPQDLLSLIKSLYLANSLSQSSFD